MLSNLMGSTLTRIYKFIIFLIILFFGTITNNSNTLYAKNLLAEIFKAYTKYQEINMMLWLAGDTKAERRFGEEVKWFLNLTNKKVKNQETLRWVNTVFERVKAQFKNLGFDYTITVYEGNTINAFAIPGGHIFIYKGMLDFVSSDDELAAVIAHELAHVERRHSLKHYRQNVAFQIILEKAVKNKRDKATWGQLVGALLMLQFSREDEFEADQIGIERMAKAGYNPQAQVVLWEKFVEKFGKGEKGLLKYLSTHPPSIERVEFAKKNLNKILAQQQALSNQTTPPIVQNTPTSSQQISQTQPNTNLSNQQPDQANQFQVSQQTSTPVSQQTATTPITSNTLSLSYNPLEDIFHNLLPNHSFETDLDSNNLPDFWYIKDGKAIINHSHSVTGKKSLEIISESPFVPSRVISDFIKINPAQSYSLQGYVKTQNSNQKINIGFECYNSKKQLLGFVWPISENSTIPNSWHIFQVMLTPAKSNSIIKTNFNIHKSNHIIPDTKFIKVILQNGPSTHKGSIFFDDLILDQYPSAFKPNLQENGDFEYALHDQNIPDGIKGSNSNIIRDLSFFKTGYASLCAFSTDKVQDIEIILNPIPLTKITNTNDINISLKYTSNKQSKFKLIILALDKTDKVLTPHIFEKEITAKPQLWLDSNNSIKISNYPFPNQISKIAIKFTAKLEPHTKLWLDNVVVR